MEKEEIISKYINSIIKRTENYKEIEAIFINKYCKDNIDYIDLNFIRNDNAEGINEEIDIPNTENIVLRIISNPSLNFNYGLMYERELKAANNLLKGTIIKDRKDNYYTNYKHDIEKLNVDIIRQSYKKIKK